MRKTSLRILKALHEGYALKRVVDRGMERPDYFYVVAWRLTPAYGTTLLEQGENPRSHPKTFSDLAHEDLWGDGLIEHIPDTGTNCLIALTPEGLALAQERFGPIATRVLVLVGRRAGVVEPTADRSPAVVDGVALVPDDMPGEGGGAAPVAP